MGAIRPGSAGGGSVTASSITDSTATGRSILTAADAAAARTAIGAGTSSFDATADATGSALHRWKLNEGTGTSFADSGSANEAMTLSGTGGIVTAPGLGGYGIRFSGGGSTWLRTGNSPATPTTNSFTVDGWVKLFSYGGGGWCAIFCKPIDPSAWAVGLQAGISFYVRNSADGAWSCGINAGGSYVDTTVGASVGGLGLAIWRHLAATYDGSTLRLYLDGVQVATRSVSGSVTWGTGPWQAGGNQNTSGDVLYGSLSDWRVQSGVLTAAQVSDRYLRGMRQGP